MNTAIAFFISEAISHARSLPLAQAVEFLRGLLQSCSDSEVTEAIRKVFISLSESDKQLDLIQAQQLKLRLDKGNSQ